MYTPPHFASSESAQIQDARCASVPCTAARGIKQARCNHAHTLLWPPSVLVSKNCICRFKADRVLCTVRVAGHAAQHRHRQDGQEAQARQVRVRSRGGAEGEPAALEAAVAAAEVAVQVAEGDDEAVREWLDGVLKQVEEQVEINEGNGLKSSVIDMTDL